MLETNSVRSNKSKLSNYIRWKVLIGLGTIFWLLLCLTDDDRERKINKEILSFGNEKFFEEDITVFPVIVQEEELPPPILEEQESFNIFKVVFWNLVAFLSTFCACFTVKCISSRMSFAGVDTYLFTNHEMAIRKHSSSRIPIPVASKTSSLDIHVDTDIIQTNQVDISNKSCPNLFGIQTHIEEKERCNDRKMWSIRVMERHCARLREEMVNLQTASLKEHAAIARRLDTLSREKRELSRQLSFAAKENKTLKQQLDDIVEERMILIKRLDSATKEIRANTKSKKTTMAKLDEALANAENIKTNLEQMTRDKVILEDKLMILDADYKRLKEELALYKQNERKSEVKIKIEDETSDIQKPNKEHAIDVYEVSDDSKTVTSKEAGDMDEKEKLRQIRGVTLNIPMEESDFDISRSEKDMKKVQQKLMTLEKSLENFKFRDGIKIRGAQEKFDLWPVNENETFLDNRSRPHLPSPPSSPYFTTPDPERRQIPAAGSSSSSPSLPAPRSSHSASSQSVCSEDQCPLDRKDCTDPECYRHHRRRRREPPVLSEQSICTEPKCTLEHRECLNAECFLQRHSISAGAVTSSSLNNNVLGSVSKSTETGSSSETNLCHVLAKEQIMMMCQKPMRYLKTTVSDDRLSAISEKITSGGEDSGDEYEPKRKIFTNTPEFQKLLKEILDPQKQSSEDIVRETDESEMIY